MIRSDLPKPSQIREWHNVDIGLFHSQIMPLKQPAVLKGIVRNWAMVSAAKTSDQTAVEYLSSHDNHTPAYTVVGTPDIEGRYFYNSDLSGVNFQRVQAAITATLEQLYALRGNPKPHSVAVQAASIRDTFPEFEAENVFSLLDKTIAPTLWLGNRGLVAPHYDVHDNIACVAMGQRRFTLFPPDQIANLYVGPSLNAPGGVPISMVNLHAPDIEQFPNFSNALAAAQTAVLEPGDAIYIPTPWWHAVESLNDINVLVNYWWGGLGDNEISPSHSLMHSMMTIAKLDTNQREAWRHFFDYFVFKTTENPVAHLPDNINDLVTSLTPEQQNQVYQLLKSQLTIKNTSTR